ncbi:hypothetical protein SNE40_017001 [Patella caerulea]|uniref:Uncharacterized protein n=1 Tax=Patella caerulea TaxID=87958 RepID=A0AAN8PD98_PATCE
MSAPMMNRKCVLSLFISSLRQLQEVSLSKPYLNTTRLRLPPNIYIRNSLENPFIKHFKTTASNNLNIKYKFSKPVKRDPLETVQLFDGSDKLICKLTLGDAQKKAKKENMKLLDIGRNPDGVLSFKYLSGKDLYQEGMKLRKTKKSSKEKEMKVVDILWKIEDHDLNRKLDNAVESLKKGHPVKFNIKGKVRLAEEATHKLLLNELKKKVKNKIETLAFIDEASSEGATFRLVARPIEEVSSEEVSPVGVSPEEVSPEEVSPKDGK